MAVGRDDGGGRLGKSRLDRACKCVCARVCGHVSCAAACWKDREDLPSAYGGDGRCVCACAFVELRRTADGEEEMRQQVYAEEQGRNSKDERASIRRGGSRSKAIVRSRTDDACGLLSQTQGEGGDTAAPLQVTSGLRAAVLSGDAGSGVEYGWLALDGL